ncbi:MAG: ATP-binding protein [Anaerolineae bacterium]|nr:ATP-binding protein [Anaerolineae bacterium]
MDFPKTETFPGAGSSLEAINTFVTEAAQAIGLDEDAIFGVQLAVEEACDNIIEHAYAGASKGDIECSCDIVTDGLKIVLRDSGRPFDPESVPKPDLDSPLEERDIGGLGLHFIKNLMDEVRFEFFPGSGNVLTMVKRKTPAG